MQTVTKKHKVSHKNELNSKQSAHLFVCDCIEKSFFKLLEKKKYDKITISEIIDKAGVSRMGFYRNYSSKEDIIERKIHTAFVETINQIIDNRPLNFSIKNIIQTSLQHLALHADDIALLLKNGLHALIFKIYKNEYFSLYKSKNQSRIKYYSSMMFIGELFTLEMAWIENGLVETPEQMAEIYSRIIKMKSERI